MVRRDGVVVLGYRGDSRSKREEGMLDAGS